MSHIRFNLVSCLSPRTTS